MMERAAEVLRWLVSLPEWLVYLVVGLAAAIENIIPPVPADVVVVIGGVITGAGEADPFALFLAVWFGNVSSALLVYALGRRYGKGLFGTRIGEFLLAPHQLEGLQRAYNRFGFPIIFFSRFLPVFRPVVPAFAGISHVSFLRTAPPIALASGLWYGLLVYLGSVAGANWRALLHLVNRFGGWMWGVAGILIVAGVVWWWRSRHPRPEETTGQRVHP